MNRISRSITVLVLAAMVPVLGACAPPPFRAPEPAVVASPPPLLIEQVSVDPVAEPAAVAVGTRPEGRLVTLTTAEADVRDILPVLAQAAGISLVLGPEVRGRVTLRLVNVPAEEALHLVIREAGLSIDALSRATIQPNMFHQPMVNVNTAGAAQISARFAVGAEVADFVVRSRTMTLPRIE